MKAKALLSATTGFFFGWFTYFVLQYLEMEDALLISVFGGLLFYILLFILLLVYGKIIDKKYAEFEGYNISEASDGIEAIEKCKNSW